MRLQVDSKYKIVISPFTFWDPLGSKLLRVRSGGVFHPSHVTTQLCLKLFKGLHDRTPCVTVLDAGCGCGILALAAVHLGAQRALGVDISPRAIRISRQNAEMNRLSCRTSWVVGTPAVAREAFDCVFANLPLGVLEETLDGLMAAVVPGGHLIVSGFQDIEWHGVRTKVDIGAMETVELRSMDASFYGVPPSGSFTWMAALLKKPARPR